MSRPVAVAVVAVALALAAPSFAQPRGSRHDEMLGQGPLPIRSQFPLDLVTLDMTPQSAFMPERGATSIDIVVTHVNTFEITPGYDERATDFEAGIFHPGWDFNVDDEATRASLTFAFQVGRRVNLGFEVPMISYGGGFMDSTIEDFHDALSLPQNDRDSKDHDLLNVDLIAGSTRFRMSDDETGLGDAVLRARVLLAHGRSAAWTAVLEAKAPTGEQSSFTGSGEWDYGLSFLVSAGSERHLFHGGLGHQVLGQPSDWPIAITDRTSGFAAYEFAPNERWSIVFQAMGATSILPEQSGYKQDGPRAELALGFHWNHGPFTLSSGFIENLTTNDNDLDLGLYVQLGWLVGER
jgi:hypothetical protein